MSSIGELGSILQLLSKLKQQYEKYQYNLEECGLICVRCKNLMISLRNSNLDKRLNCPDITNYIIDLKEVLIEVENYLHKYESKSYMKQILRAGKYQMKFQLLNDRLDKCHKDLQLILATKNLDVALDIKTLLSTPQSPKTPFIADSFVRDPPPIDEFDERSVLGFGFFGTTHVMKIIDDPIGIKYAVKVVNVQKAIKNGITISEVEDEARKLQSLNHPNIVRYVCCFYSGRNNSNFNIATELISSGSLSTMIGKHHDERMLLKWLIELTDALKYLHQKKILHRDLKPDNCMLTKSQQIKIIDLGLATIISSSHQVRTRVGTAQYASFEKCNGKAYDGRDDIWAMGCIMIELIIRNTLMNRSGSISMYLDAEINKKRLDLIEECKSIFPKLGHLIEFCLAPLQDDRINAEMLQFKLEEYDSITIINNSNNDDNDNYHDDDINSTLDNDNDHDSDINSTLNSNDDNRIFHLNSNDNNLNDHRNSNVIESKTKEDVSLVESILYQIERRALSGRLEEEQRKREIQSKVEYEQNLKREIEEQKLKKKEAQNMQIQRKEALEQFKKEQKMKALVDIKALKNCVSIQAHAGFIMSVVLSSDGCTIATASQDKTIKLWETLTGKLITTLISHSDIVYSVAISIECDFLVSSSRDQTIKLWGITGTLIRTLNGHEGGVRSVCISSDSKLIISGSDDTTVKVWSIVGSCLSTFFGHHAFVRSVLVTEEFFVISASSDKLIKLWNMSGTCIHTFEGHNSDVTSLSLAGDILASSSGDSTVKLWQIKTKECIKTYTGDSSIGPVNSVYISPDKQLILAAQDKHLWYIYRDDIKVIEYHHTSQIRSVCASIDKSIIITGSNDLNIKIYPTVNLNSSLFSSIINVSLLSTLFSATSK